MLSILVGTNAKNSNTEKVAQVYHRYLHTKNIPHQIIRLADLPADFINTNMYKNRAPSFVSFQEQYLIPTQKFITIVPEYNGGIPGIFKLMIDASDVKKAWHHKKASITGVAAGRAGNLRGIDFLTNVFNHLKMQVLPNKLPISKVHELLDGQGQMIDAHTVQAIEEQIEQFLIF